VDANLGDVTLLPGSKTTGTIGYDIIDHTIVPNGHKFQLTFEDTLYAIRNMPDTLYTKSFTLTDVTNPSSPVVLLSRNPLVKPGEQLPTTLGFQLKLQNEPMLTVDTVASHWSRPDIYAYDLSVFSYQEQQTLPHVDDFRIEFGELGMDTSLSYLRGRRELPPMPVNFTVKKIETGEKIPFAFRELDEDVAPGIFSAMSEGRTRTDEIILLNTVADSLVASWQLSCAVSADDSVRSYPAAGDFIEIYLHRPFMSYDVVEFTTHAPSIDEEAGKGQMDDIKVVPNPYVVTNSWEPLNPYSNGRGPRELHFTHLPPNCTIKIFNVRGQLVRTLEHNTDIWDGTEVWDMQSKDQLDIAYGVYVYHVDAGEMGQKIGKFAIIK
jgi:hypothetical protein